MAATLARQTAAPAVRDVEVVADLELPPAIPAESLRDARAELGESPVQRATGWAFIALGAG